MDRFFSTADMLAQYEQRGWTKNRCGYGFSLTPPAETAVGRIVVWGRPDSLCFISTDLVFCNPLMERYYYSEKSIQISFVDDMTATYYQNRSESHEARIGLYCYVNNLPKPWFKRFPADTRQKVNTLLITEKFLNRYQLPLPHDGWDRLARALNGKEISIPALAFVCQQVKNAGIAADAFELFLSAKAAEAVSLLLDFMLKAEATAYPSVTEKSRAAARTALQILNDSFQHPPVIEHLAQSVGIDKKTLQTVFRQMTSQTIHDYIQTLRMEKALSLLENSSLRIEDIAQTVGYHSKINFYQAFKKTFDCTPNEMKKQIFRVSPM